MHTTTAAHTTTTLTISRDINTFDVEVAPKGAPALSDVRRVTVVRSDSRDIPCGHIGSLIRECGGWTPVAYLSDGSVRGWGKQSRNRSEAINNLVDLVLWGPS